MSKEEIAAIDENDQGFKDFAQVFHKEEMGAYTPLEDYKKTLRWSGQMSTEEIAAVDVNDTGFKSYARVFHKEVHKEIMANAEQAAESASAASETASEAAEQAKEAAAEAVGSASEAATQAAAEVAQEVAQVAQEAAEEAAEQISKSSDDIFNELGEINDAFFEEARASGMTISEYSQTEAGKANEAAAQQKRIDRKRVV